MEDDGNGRVQYDPAHAAKTLSHDDAQALVQLLFERNRGMFGALLAEVITGQRFAMARQRKD